MAFNLKKILKALLISTSEPLSIREIQTVFTRYHERRERLANTAGTPARETGGNATTPPASAEPEQELIRDIIDQVPTLLTATQIREAAEELNQEMETAGDVTRILQSAEGFRLVVAPDFAGWVRILRNDPRPQKLTQASLETLAIVAYRQPTTRGEIEAIRGVSADSAVSRLLDLELITVSGRADLPGRPFQFSTTPKFLDFVGLRTLSELPESDVLSPAQISAWIERAKNQGTIGAGDVGLAPEDFVPATQTQMDFGANATLPPPPSNDTPPPEI